MKKLQIFFLLFLLASCELIERNNNYKIITDEAIQKLNALDTLVNKPTVLVLKIGTTDSDPYPQLLVKTKSLGNGKNFLFDESELENDSIILCYSPGFIYDENGGFSKNGIWVYTKFYRKGSFPFETECMNFSVDSIPLNWKKELPIKEGIYFYQNQSLTLLTTEQSEKKYKEAKKNGFYFFPNKGRLFDRININHLE